MQHSCGNLLTIQALNLVAGTGRCRRFSWRALALLLVASLSQGLSQGKPAQAQSNFSPNRPEPIPQTPLPSEPLPPLPPPEELLPTPGQQPPLEPELPGEVPSTIYVERYDVQGSTVFSNEELAEVTAPFAGRDISFAELLQARSAVTQLYIDRGYLNSGAFIPPQTLNEGVVVIQVIEGELEAINISGTRRLNPGYIRSRLAIAAEPPLNVPQLLEGLQLLQLDPLIQNISADLQAGTRPGTSILEVQVIEADSFSTSLLANNGRSPSVGSFRRGVEVTEANVLGWGDGLTLNYLNTDGSNEFNGSYTLPINPRNGTVRIAAGVTDSEVIEEPFNVLDIQSNSNYLELSVRQPFVQTPSEEFAMGLTLSHQDSKTQFLEDEVGFPSPGADEDGRTSVTALRFFQEWTRRSSQEVLAARSQFSIGLDLFDSTVEGDRDSRFFAWRGQGQWVRLLAPDTLLLVRGDLQLSDEPLLGLEQFGLGGQESIRGYRQDALLADNGLLLSAEARLPILRVPEIDGLLQIVPFFDVGTVWSSRNEDPNGLTTNTLVGTGLGLLWQQGDYFSARLDWGIPLSDIDTVGDTWQENGVYFSIVITPF